MLQREDRRQDLSRAIHSSRTVPNLYGGITAGGKQAVCTDLCLVVGLTLDQVEICDMVGGIQEAVAISWHGAPVVRAASPRQAAQFLQVSGVAGVRGAHMYGKSSQFDTRSPPDSSPPMPERRSHSRVHEVEAHRDIGCPTVSSAAYAAVVVLLPRPWSSPVPAPRHPSPCRSARFVQWRAHVDLMRESPLGGLLGGGPAGGACQVFHSV